MKIEIEPIWRFTQEGNSESLHLAPEFLNSIQITRTISCDRCPARRFAAGLRSLGVGR
jgi:hypothetical protein